MTRNLLEMLDRFPEPEHPSLKAWDATDTLLLDTAFPSEEKLSTSAVIAIDGDRYGALTLSVAARFPVAEIRVYQDVQSGSLALEHNRSRLAEAGIALGAYTECATRSEAFRDATHLLVQLPKAVTGVEEIALAASRAAAPHATLYAGARLKYLVPAMTDALLSGFETVQAGLARQKSRVLTAYGPRDSAGSQAGGSQAVGGNATSNSQAAGELATGSQATDSQAVGKLETGSQATGELAEVEAIGPAPFPLQARFPLKAQRTLTVAGSSVSMTVCAFGETFGGTQIDAGTALLLENLPELAPEFAPGMRVHDLGCGNGTVVAALKLRFPDIAASASDVSRSAVRSTHATLNANGIDVLALEAGNVEENRSESDSPGDPVRTLVTPGLLGFEPGSCHAVVLNPPFHQGGRVDESLAAGLLDEAARVLRPGGTLYVVWNSHLRYRRQLERIVGPTAQLARNARFTVTASRSASRQRKN